MTGFYGGEQGEQDVRLTDTERKMVARLLSDPTYFPVEFRTWLKNYIEGAGINVTASQIRGSATVRTGLPAGTIIVSAGTLPPDALPTDGTAYSRSLYNLLFTIIGTTWGAGDGSSTFNVPDFRDRVLVASGNQIVLAQTDGKPLGQRGPVHGTSVQANPGFTGTPASHAHPPESANGQLNFWGGVASGGVQTATSGGFNFNAFSNTGYATLTPAGTISGGQYGPAGGMMDSPAFAGVNVGITTGQTG